MSWSEIISLGREPWIWRARIVLKDERVGPFRASLTALLAILFLSLPARAQTAAPAFSPPTPAPQPVAWQPGSPPPPGYHVEDRPRTGLVVAGAIIAGIPYFFSVVTASAASQANETEWLYVPVAGPWMTLGQRSYASCNTPDNASQSTSQSLACVGDIFAVMGLITDGIMQATGATLLLVGVAAGRPTLVRDDEAVHVTPMRIGSGYGAGLAGTF